MAFQLTDEQQTAVDNRGGGILVSAAAGSGKTRVLVERLLTRVVEEGLNIDRFLVITYTKAAAAELRGRIAQELSERLAQQPNNRHLRRQTTLVYRAQISTIHSFCGAMLRENGHKLNLDPDYRLCDEGESVVLMAQVLEEVMERQYEAITSDSDFSQLVDTLSAGRDDTKLQQIVLDVFGRIQSHPNPAEWLAEQTQLWTLEGVADVGDTPWGGYLLDYARREGEYHLARLGEGLALCDSDAILSLNYAESLSGMMAGIQALIAATAESWDATVSSFPIPVKRAGVKRGVENVTAAEQVKYIRTRAKDAVGQLQEWFAENSETTMRDLARVRPTVRGLMALVGEFSKAYAQEKNRRGVLDFSDLEHMAVKLLVGADGLPTPLSELWAQKYTEVMVDEYQDTNQVQNAIFTAISDGGKKLFMVGDVKQSIYRFRLADPTIFLRKYREFPSWDRAQDGESRSVVLSKNFRSRPEVLLGCNDLFRALMTREFGELDYTADQELVPGASFPDGAGYDVELNALNLQSIKTQEGEKTHKDLVEARWAAHRIATLLDESHQEYTARTANGEDCQPPLTASDVMILLRSPGSVLHHYIRALDELGVPWSAQGGGDFFGATEVGVALSILRVVDNPRQDVALVATLRSPVYGFTGDQLAQLGANRKSDLYDTVVVAAANGDAPCAEFLKDLDALRFGAGEQTCRQLIWHIYEKTNLLGLYGALDGGETRQANLLTLYSLAGQLESVGCRSLFQFIQRLDRLRETGKSIAVPQPGQDGGGVTIMSIHRSKGLEKPVVLVCGLSRQINRNDLRRPVLFHPSLGVGPKGLDTRRMVEYPTLARHVVALQMEREMMAEELRLLYVAMTRAREKLILSVTLADGGKTVDKLSKELALPLPPVLLAQQSNMGSWILLHALTRPDGLALHQLGNVAGAPTMTDATSHWDIRVTDGEKFMKSKSQQAQISSESLPDTQAQEEEKLYKFDWQYRYCSAVDTPSKMTPTGLKGDTKQKETAEDAVQMAQPAEESPWHASAFDRPRFMTEQKGLTATQRGTAIHLVMQYLPLHGDTSPTAVAQEVARLVSEGYLTPQQGAVAEPGRLAAFLDAPLGRQMAAAQRCEREFKFSLLLEASDYYPDVPKGDEIMLQGVLDCWFEDDSGITIVDYKSDRVTPETATVRGEEYRPQMEAYAMALGKILGRPVARCVLWFFSANCAIELTIGETKK